MSYQHNPLMGPVFFTPPGSKRLFKGGGGGQVKYDNLERLYDEQAASARLLRGIAEQNLPGATQAYVGNVQNVLAPDYANRQANMAGADMAGANAMERAATERNLASMGVNPNDPRFTGALRSAELNNAARLAAGRNLSRNEAEQYQLNVAKDAVGTFTGQSNNAATQMGKVGQGLGTIYADQANAQADRQAAQSNAVGDAVAGGMAAYSLFKAKDGGKAMSGLSLLGGIGRGVQQGAAFIQQKRMQDEEMSMRRERQNVWRDQQDRETRERERLDGWNTLSQRIDTEYQTLGPVERNTMKMKMGFETGLIPPDEFSRLQATTEQLEREGLMGDILTGDTNSIAAKFTKRFGKPIGVQTAKSPTGSTLYRLTGEDGKVYNELSDEQIGAVMGMKQLMDLGEVRRTNQEHMLKQQKTRSEIGENQAQASAASALAAQRRADAAGGGGGGLSMLKGQTAAVKEAAFIAELEDKVTRGEASPQEEATLLQLRARTAPKPYTPPAVKSANYWRSAPADEIEAEVDRQVSAALAKAPPGSWERDQLERPENLEAIRRDIRGRLGVPAPAPRKAPNLDSYFK